MSSSESTQAQIRLELARARKKNPTPAKGRATRTSKKKDNPPEKENKAPQRAGSLSVPWRRKDVLKYTYELLSIISDKTKYKIAFNMDKGAASLDPDAPEDPNKSNPTAATQKDHAESIARKLFLPTVREDGTISYAVKDGSLNGLYTVDDLPALGTIVKARILALKKKYTESRSRLGETGMGLAARGKTSEMTPGSHMKNVWDDIVKKFPFFMTLHALMGSSPTVDRAAMANSMTQPDTSILGRGNQPFDAPDTTMATSASSDEISAGSGASRKRPRDTLSVSDSSSIIGGDLSEGESSDSSELEEVPAPKARKTLTKPSVHTPSKPVVPVPSASAQKRRQPIEVVAESAAEDRAVRIELGKFKELKKTERSEAKARFQYKAELAKLKQQQVDAELRLEQERLVREENERQRAFQREMMQQQLELERLRAGLAGAHPPYQGINPAGPPPTGPPYHM
ncbi:hypothetical protein GGG16DRAFT_101908 [Schizophyllum commune]